MRMYKVTQHNEDLFYPEGATLSECIESIAQWIGYYMNQNEKIITVDIAIDAGIRVEVL